MSGAEKTTDKANQNLDQAALEEGQRQNVNQSKLAACVRKQDARAVTKSEEQAQADPLDLNSVPTLFINGEKVDGVVPIETLYHIIDRALITAQR
jgi:protein-disulfide isomerase